MFNLSRSLLASLMAVLGRAAPQFSAPQHPSARRLGKPETIRGHVKVRYSRYTPHQGVRERLRRIGGDNWANFKAFDRKRRGLPAGIEEISHG